MRRVFRPLDWAVCSGTLTIALALLPVQTRAQTPAPTPTIDSVSTQSGIYTDEQARRGKDIYANLCKSCHNPSTGDAFARRWAGKTLLDMFTYIYESMPDNNPHSVDEASNADIIGYLMQSTGMPVGTRDVPIAPDSLKAIYIEVKKTPPPPGGRHTSSTHTVPLNTLPLHTLPHR